MPKRLSPETFKAVYNTVPRLCVDLVIRKDEGILLIERAIDPGKGLWHLPGGTVLLGESLDQAIQRIVLDETGLEVTGKQLVGMLEFSDENTPFFHTVSAVYQVMVNSGTPRGSNQGKNVVFWTQLPEKMIREQKAFITFHKLI
jgi:ADP-ribose pyrophosphatase YjhB (NUDIX family)